MNVTAPRLRWSLDSLFSWEYLNILDCMKGSKAKDVMVRTHAHARMQQKCPRQHNR